MYKNHLRSLRDWGEMGEGERGGGWGGGVTDE